MDKFDEVRRKLVVARESLAGLRWQPGDAMDGLAQDWLALSDALKDAVFYGNPKNPNPDRSRFETESAAQSMQFAIDLLPSLRAVITRDYPRGDLVRLLDVGAGSGSGASLIAQLHASAMLHARIDVEAIDVVPWRSAWVATQHPRVNYHVCDAEALPARNWDLVLCSHVIEHLEDPRAMIRHILRACRGHALVYAPYRESPLSAGHVSIIDEGTFANLGRPCEITILDSLGWAGEDRRCILAVIDCRDGGEPCS